MILLSVAPVVVLTPNWGLLHRSEAPVASLSPGFGAVGSDRAGIASAWLSPLARSPISSISRYFERDRSWVWVWLSPPACNPQVDGRLKLADAGTRNRCE